MVDRRRAEDDVTLHILDLHVEGLNAEQIGRVIGMAPSKVRARIRRAITEDCLYDPEAETYWKGQKQ